MSLSVQDTSISNASGEVVETNRFIGRIPRRDTVLRMSCEPFAASQVKPGWVCCDCRHFNPWDGYQCWKCDHLLCLVSPTPHRRQMTSRDFMKGEMVTVFTSSRVNNPVWQQAMEQQRIARRKRSNSG